MYGHARRAELEHAGRDANPTGRIRDAPIENVGADLDRTGHVDQPSNTLHEDDGHRQQH